MALGYIKEALKADPYERLSLKRLIPARTAMTVKRARAVTINVAFTVLNIRRSPDPNTLSSRSLVAAMASLWRF